MSSDDQKATLKQLDQLILIRARMAGLLRSEAKARRKAGDQSHASALSRQATRLNQQNFRILHTRRKLQATESLNDALNKLRAITADAQRVEADLRQGAELLASAATLVQIITRLSGLFA
jgi:hypothetical protein